MFRSNKTHSGSLPGSSSLSTGTSYNTLKGNRKKANGSFNALVKSVIKISAIGACFYLLGRRSSATPVAPEASSSTTTMTKIIEPIAVPVPAGIKEFVASDESAARIRSQVHDHIHTKMFPRVIGDHEIILVSLLGGLMREEGLIPEGTFLDAGAQYGEQGAHYAVIAPDRQVLCLDPSPDLVEKIKAVFGKLPNLRVEQGGLGKEVGVMKPRDKYFNMDLDAEFPVYSLDSLFYDKGVKLAFAHLDVEGLELDVLKGGVQTLRADRPIFTTEVRVHDHEYTTELLNFLDQEGYDTYVINEVCGYPFMDLRNLLNIPRKMSKTFARSDTFNLLLATDSIFRVTADEDNSIFEAVYPCCALGGECCPGDDLADPSCCSEVLVDNWLEQNNINKRPPAMVGWKSARKEFETWQYRLRARSNIA
jgi:FkbM family methyltransferase